jgi:VIT1/CCC1 family predicted Fe2+/Mn2+ transporter
MRKIIIVFLAAVFSISSNAGIIYVPANSTDNAKAGMEATIEKVKSSDMNAFLTLTPAKIQKMTGKKMSIGQKLALKLAQKKIKKQLNNSNAIDTKDESQMLRLWLIFAAVAIVLGVLGWVVPFFWFLSGLAWLASLIFFILWIIALSA